MVNREPDGLVLGVLNFGLSLSEGSLILGIVCWFAPAPVRFDLQNHEPVT